MTLDEYQSTIASEFQSDSVAHPDGWADGMRSIIAREQWADYVERFQPLERELIDNITSGKRMETALGKVDSSMGTQYAKADDSYQRNMSRYGIGQSNQQQKQHQSRLGLSKAASTANQRNTARRRVSDSNMQFMSGAGSAKEELV